MTKHLNTIALTIPLLSIGIGLYSFFSPIFNYWIIAPQKMTMVVLLILSLITFVVGLISVKGQSNWKGAFKSWLSVMLSAGCVFTFTLLLLFISFFSSLNTNKYIKTVQSPDESYAIDFYYWDTGATGSFGVKGVVDGPLWFTRRVYTEEETMSVEVEWEENVPYINGNEIDVKNGGTIRY